MSSTSIDRRDFLKTSGAAVAGALAVSSAAGVAIAQDAAPVVTPAAPESIVKLLYQSLSPAQREAICFDWDFVDDRRGLLRTRVANNWNVTEQEVNGRFYSKDQRQMIRDVFEGIIQPDWHEKIDKQLSDDAGGFGNNQSIAIFGTPGDGNFELVLTGRHMTLRCDGDSADHVAFGGPIFYGHAVQGTERAGHPGNVFWEQAMMANEVYEMLDGKQRTQAEVAQTPRESSVGFKGMDGQFPGIPIAELSSDQQEHAQRVLAKLIEPYRQSDRDEALACLKKQGGLDACSLAFFTDRDIGNDRVWDNWRIEGPSFVWYFRGSPHVHVWVNVADDAAVKLNA